MKEWHQTILLPWYEQDSETCLILTGETTRWSASCEAVTCSQKQHGSLLAQVSLSLVKASTHFSVWAHLREGLIKPAGTPLSLPLLLHIFSLAHFYLSLFESRCMPG